MKKQLVAMVLLLPLLLGGCESCQPGQPDQDVGAGDTTIADTVAGTDGAGETVDVDVADAADVPGDVTDPAAGACDKDLPMPGEPCTTIGEVRCTNVGATPGLDGYGLGVCYRPNKLVCKGSEPKGAAVWLLEPCPTAETQCSAAGNFCASGVTGDKCVPAILANNGNKLPPGSLLGGYEIRFCESHVDAEACAAVWPARCTTFDQLTPEVKEAVLDVLAPCASSLSDVPYLFPSALCPPDEIFCKNIPATATTPPGSTPVYLNKCVVDKLTGKPRCAKTCEDMGVKEVW